LKRLTAELDGEPPHPELVGLAAAAAAALVAPLPEADWMSPDFKPRV
jgi:hypothetical protein